jgi:hypothetical protein
MGLNARDACRYCQCPCAIEQTLLTVPEILFLVSTQDLSFASDEIRDISQLLLSRLFVSVKLYDCSWNDANLELLGQSPVLIQIDFPLSAQSGKFWCHSL